VASKCLILFSGGIDSTVALYLARTQFDAVQAFGVDYGQPHVKELEAAYVIAKEAGVWYDEVKVSGTFGVPDDLIFPNRNAILVSLAAAHALQVGAVAVGFSPHADDAALFPDCRPKFIEAMNEVLRVATDGKVWLWTPFLDFGKRKVVELGRALGAPLDQTWSCYGHGTSPCLTCLACTERARALA